MESVYISLFTPRKPEKVLFLLDVAGEQQSHECTNEPQTYTKKKKFQHVKRAIEIFVRSKAQMDELNQFAIMTVDASPMWHVEFTSKVDIFAQYLKALEATGMGGACDLDGFAPLLRQKFDIREGEELPFALHIVFVYTRTVPQPMMGEEGARLLKHPDVHFDYISACDARTPRVDSQSISQKWVPSFLLRLERASNYTLEVASDIERMLLFFSLIAAHPSQRTNFQTTAMMLQRMREIRVKWRASKGR